MGLGIGSSSSFDSTSHQQNKYSPDSSNWIIEKYCHVADFLIIFIIYPDCINYEGKKILVFKGVHISVLKKQKVIDPHFSENTNFYSPVARFVPTENGWKMAIIFCKMSEMLESLELIKL